MTTIPNDDTNDKSAYQPEPVETAGAVAFKAALAQARKDGFAITPADREHMRLRAIPLGLADRLAQMSDPAAIAAVLLQAINKALDSSKD
ncbi:hypothetical protein [Paraburkholderia sp. BCC1884]|uniref:hypothetical protein n=1 Tax=Paraburkholderia sp. BCC1884 TaxID=2562668 RepID=UPI001182DCCC|nr:hypothetical protein [Paraburkholderia sp. BCC1884]